MTSMVIMSTMGTTFSSALVPLRPRTILPPSTLERWSRGAGRLPGWTMAMRAPSLDPGHGDLHEADGQAGVDDVDQVAVGDGVLGGDDDRALVGELALDRLEAGGQRLQVLEHHALGAAPQGGDVVAGVPDGEGHAALAHRQRH